MDKATATLELRDIHLPTDPSIWPLAIGWWLLIICVVIIAYLFWKKLAQLRKQKQLNNLLQQELLDISNRYKIHQNKPKLASEVSILLNRFVKYGLKDTHATALTGNQWIEYLNHRVDTNNHRGQLGVFSEFSKELTQAQYMRNVDFDVPRLIATVKNYFPKAIKSMQKVDKLKQGTKHA
ncbi:hypothetical protein MNBD_GAMMA01-2156 [hydrothermal vent metagenome]|uniref:DUF4381 domain-containing protein n=1 Tax=hydrothermal vent metagenome TaxID=652676 RepID=A0A3B0VDB4_9ZZZZ